MNNLGSILFYFIIILLTTLFCELSINLNDKIARKIFKYITILIPSIIAGIRIDVGTDYNLYNRAFYDIANGISNRYEDFEIGYKVINNIIYKLGLNFHWVLFVMNFFTILFIYKALNNEKKYIKVSFGMMMYMFLYYQTSLNLIRQSLAISICIYAITCIYTNNIKKFVFLIILASSFHKSALICFTILLIKYIFESYKKRLFKLTTFITLILLVFNKEIIAKVVLIIFNSNYYAGYFLRQTETGGSLAAYIVKIIPFIIIYFIFIQSKNKSKNFNLYANLMLSGYILGILRIFSVTQVQRIAFYFTYLNIILTPYVLRKACDKNYRIIKILIIIFIIFTWYFEFFVKGYSETVPYKQVLF